jgi:hypothetical protein
MRRHGFDAISLVFGLVFGAAGIIVLAGGSLAHDGELLLPATLVGLGVALLVQNALRSRTAPVVRHRDLDTAEAPIDDLDEADDLWPTTHRSASGIEWTGTGQTSAPDDPSDPNPD